MSRRIIRTTRRVQTTGDQEPAETVHEREVDRVLRNGNEIQVYEQEETRPEYYTDEPIVHATRDQLTVLNSWMRSLQNLTQRQLTILRDFDSRLAGLEEVNRIRENSSSFERSTWWALWGILMLLLGSALVVILILIFTSVLR